MATKTERKAKSLQMKMTVKMMKVMARKSGMIFSGGPQGKLDVEAVRKTMESGYSRYPVARKVVYADYNICPVHMEVLTPGMLKTNHIIFYIHGGGFICGSAALSRGFASFLATDMGCLVYTVDYRLAPEHKFPAAVDDCYTAYKALLSAHPDTRIAVMGESAGATLTLAVTLRSLQEGIQSPCCIILHSPVGSLADIGREKYDTDDIMVSKDFFYALGNALYEDGQDLTNPDLSPLYGDFHDFPPVFLTSDAKETLSVDARLLYEKMEDSNVDVTWVSLAGSFHAFGAAGRGTPESALVMDESEIFMRQHFD